MKYTKGPWDVAVMINKFVPKSQGGGEKITVWAGKGNDRKRIATATKYGNLSETKANARLITAAPELLEALEMIISNGPLVEYIPREVLKLVNKALAKAEGA